MPANSWPENDSYSELWSDITDPASEDVSSDRDAESEDFSQSSEHFYGGRQRKAAVVLTIVWSGTIALHLFSWGTWIVLGFTGVMMIHAVRVLRARPRSQEAELSGAWEDLGLRPLTATDDLKENWPSVSLLVAAKNEEAVIGQLVKTLCNLDYPADRYELWAIDDNSSDRTPILLDQLALEYQQLKVFHRGAGAMGGKSGALNQVLPLTNGEILAVFDADALVSPDVLRQVLPIFERQQVGAVQMQKAIANTDVNFWTQGQAAEMALDSFFQQQRIAIGGIGELRGNGQFIRRSALLGCAGFNEETITDDLDLTVRLHLEGWDIEFSMVPVQEEGVTNPLALWHQRNRWAEGGLQRYLDYWQLIFRNRMGYRKTWDMLMFWIIQYFLPMAAVPDSLMAIIRNRLPIYSPITTLMFAMSIVGMFTGLRRIRSAQNLSTNSVFVTLLETLRGMIYMLHWLVVISSVSARMSLRPKRLKWVKTVHKGQF